VMRDVPAKLNVPPIHKERNLGEGIRVAMIDTGFAHSHPFFTHNGFTSSVVLAPSATNRATDPGSHGTGESANVFAIAPKVTFIGVKLGDDADPNGGASILEGFQEALKHKPHVITVSMCYDLRADSGRAELDELPNGLKPLEAEIQAAIAAGVVVVFSAGNGHYAFPASMPEVLSVGGAFIAEDGSMRASDYASAFTSTIYSGRHVPDVCGLVGLLPHADYIMLPVPPGEEIDSGNAEHDGTSGTDGWAVFSGTSASAPQIAAVCALLLQKNPRLNPAEVKALLVRTAIDVASGAANPASGPNGEGVPAGPGVDGATGAGLVNAHAAWLQA
jgi:subtilisin family serine protease